jgi:hypothetical protein
VGFLCLVTSLSFAQEKGVLNTNSEIVLKGDIIDTWCTESHKGDLLNYVKKHTKYCSIACEKGGYSILADGVLYMFDTDSNVKIVDFLKKPEGKQQVVITAKRIGDKLSLITIESQK